MATLLWDVLARVGVPGTTIEINQQFHDACAYVCSWVTRIAGGLRPGCVCILTALLFNTFFAAVLRAALQRFLEGPAIFEGLEHLNDPTVEGPGEPQDSLAKVMGLVGMVPLPWQELAKTTGVIVEICKACGLTVSENKPTIVCMTARGKKPEKLEINAAGQY